MAHNHRMQGIADPYINQRNEMIAREQETRSRMQMPHASEGYPGLEGRSDMHDEYTEDEDGYSQGPNTTDADLMPEGSKDMFPYAGGGSSLPINPAVRAFQESGHGVQVFEGYKGQ